MENDSREIAEYNGIYCPEIETRHILQVYPEHELVFKGPFYRPSLATIKVTNPSGMRVVFTFKTTTPDRFLVNPVSSLLEPGSTCVVRILMYPNVANKDIEHHHFRMLSMAISNTERITNLDRIWVMTQPDLVLIDSWRCRFNHIVDPDEYKWSLNAQTNQDWEPDAVLAPEEMETLVMISELKAENEKLRSESERLLVHKMERKMREGKQRAMHRKTLMEKVRANLRDGLVMAGVDSDHPCIRNVLLNDNVFIMCCCVALFIFGLLLGKFFF